MADFALRLKVFVASPGDLIAERDIVEMLVSQHAIESARHRLLLQCFRWENGITPGFERPNARTLRQVRTAELTVVMFWSRLGSAASVGSSETGSVEEMRVAGERVLTGMSDDVFVYFKTAPPPPSASPEDVQKVAALRQSMEGSKEILLSTFQTPLDFENLFRQHIRLWTERWQGIPEICEFALDHSGGLGRTSGRPSGDLLHDVLMQVDLTELRILFPVIGKHATEIYQRLGPQGWVQALGPEAERAVRQLHRDAAASIVAKDDASTAGDLHAGRPPLARVNGHLQFTDQRWFFLFCAAGLLEAISAARVEAVMRVPYVNDVHQFVKALAKEFRMTQALATVLRRWLVSEDGCTDNRPIARNFAAYELGMLGIIDAQDDLMRVIHEDPGRDVRLYAIAALGKLRARQHMPELRTIFTNQQDFDTRLMTAQAVSRMAGVVDYEM